MKLETIPRKDKEGCLFVEQTLLHNLLAARKNAIKYNGDLLIVIDGEEGSGKSTFARQVAKILDRKFTEEQITFSTAEAMQSHYDLPSWRSIILDESKPDLNRKRTMSTKNIHFTDFLSQSRILNKFFIVVLPSIYDLDKYVAEHRAKLLLHTYKNKKQQLGQFSFFGKRGIKKLFNFCSKYRTYDVKPSFIGRFTEAEVVDTKRYDEMKRKAVDRFKNNAMGLDRVAKNRVWKEYLIYRCYETMRIYDHELRGKEITIERIAKILGMGASTVTKYSQMKEEAKQVEKMLNTE